MRPLDLLAADQIQHEHMEAQSKEARLPDVQIRDATAADAAAVARLAEQLGYPTQPAEIVARLPIADDPHPDRVIVATEAAGGVVAWTTVGIRSHIHSAPYAEISGFVVDQRVRGKGIGKRLMAEVEQWAMGNKLSAIRLSANVNRTEAHRFYKSLGFKVIKQQYAFRKELQ